MFIIHGAYHFWPKPVAFRDDYCLSCQSPRRSIAIRTLDVGHIFWIPVLPVGFWKHWKCISCGKDPHVNPKTRRSFLWAGLLCLIARIWCDALDPANLWTGSCNLAFDLPLAHSEGSVLARATRRYPSSVRCRLPIL